MATVLDVAASVIEKHGGPISAMKLQKLVYYCQAWHLVWEEQALFDDVIEAWANGPVVRVLYERHRGAATVEDISGGNPAALTPDEASTVEAVYETYGRMSGYELSQLTHREAPWLDARSGLPPGARSSEPITDAAMAEYYGSLV